MNGAPDAIFEGAPLSRFQSFLSEKIALHRAFLDRSSRVHSEGKARPLRAWAGVGVGRGGRGRAP